MGQRLDQYLVAKGYAQTTKEAMGLILAGQVMIQDCVYDKPGLTVDEDAVVIIKGQKRFVSRGGLKLLKGIDHFAVQVKGMTCADIGASSGGFTDCLLQHEAQSVYAVDVAYGQLDWKIRQDTRVVVIERFNARHLSQQEVPNPIDLAVIDASFISLTLLLPPLLPLFRDQVRILALVKPQFELPRDCIGKGGVVQDSALHQKAIDKVADFAIQDLGLKVVGHVASPILGPKGNKEFIIYLNSEV